MISAIIILLVIAGLAYAGTLLNDYPGSITLNLADGSYQMPLWYFLLALVATVIVAIIVFKIISLIVRLPSIFKQFGKNRQALKASKLLQKGMLAMGKGQWRKAEKLLAKGAKLSYKCGQNPGLFLSNAAQAAQKLGATERRDEYLLEARQLVVEGEDTLNTALDEAQLHLDTNQPQRAIDVLKQHSDEHYSNTRLQTLETEAYEQLGQYYNVWNMLKSQKKAYPTKAAFLQRKLSVATALFAADNSTLEEVEIVWSELPKAQRKEVPVILSYVSSLIAHNEHSKAEKVLSKAIKMNYSDQLVDAYTQLDTSPAQDRLQTLSNWLRAQPDNAYLNYGVAKLSFQLDDVEKAKLHAEKSIATQALPEALALLGKIYDTLGQDNEALQAYRTVMGLSYTDHNSISKTGEVLPAADVKALTEK